MIPENMLSQNSRVPADILPLFLLIHHNIMQYSMPQMQMYI